MDHSNRCLRDNKIPWSGSLTRGLLCGDLVQVDESRSSAIALQYDRKILLPGGSWKTGKLLPPIPQATYRWRILVSMLTWASNCSGLLPGKKNSSSRNLIMVEDFLLYIRIYWNGKEFLLVLLYQPTLKSSGARSNFVYEISHIPLDPDGCVLGTCNRSDC